MQPCKQAIRLTSMQLTERHALMHICFLQWFSIASMLATDDYYPMHPPGCHGFEMHPVPALPTEGYQRIDRRTDRQIDRETAPQGGDRQSGNEKVVAPENRLLCDSLLHGLHHLLSLHGLHHLLGLHCLGRILGLINRDHGRAPLL